MEVHEDDAAEVRDLVSSVDVFFIVLNKTEKNVSIKRLTVTTMPFTGPKMTMRTRPKPKVKPAASGGTCSATTKDIHKMSPLGLLKWGLDNKRFHVRGWLKDVLIQCNLLAPGKDALWARVFQTWNCQKAALEGMEQVCADMGTTYKGPRQGEELS
jgi:hypothetical protein